MLQFTSCNHEQLILSSGSMADDICMTLAPDWGTTARWRSRPQLWSSQVHRCCHGKPLHTAVHCHELEFVDMIGSYSCLTIIRLFMARAPASFAGPCSCIVLVCPAESLVSPCHCNVMPKVGTQGKRSKTWREAANAGGDIGGHGRKSQ